MLKVLLHLLITYAVYPELLFSSLANVNKLIPNNKYYYVCSVSLINYSISWNLVNETLKCKMLMMESLRGGLSIQKHFTSINDQTQYRYQFWKLKILHVVDYNQWVKLNFLTPHCLVWVRKEKLSWQKSEILCSIK